MKTTKLMVIFAVCYWGLRYSGEQNSYGGAQFQKYDQQAQQRWSGGSGGDCLVIGVIYGAVVSYLYDFYDSTACLTGVRTQTHDDTGRRGEELRIAFPTYLIAFKSGSCSWILLDPHTPVKLNERMFLGRCLQLESLVNGSVGNCFCDQLTLFSRASQFSCDSEGSCGIID